MKIFFVFLAAFAFAVDYDCIFVGSSPIPLFEALYQSTLGNRVLILEGDAVCGGAWKPVDACGIAHADLGCHQISNEQVLADFFELYGGCKIIQLEEGKKAFYFQRGCYELMHNLEQTIEVNPRITLQTNSLVQRVNLQNGGLVVETDSERFTTNKLYITPYTYFSLNGNQETPRKAKFYHLYLLVSDPTPPRFSYSHGLPNTSRMMNVTRFVDIPTGQQLIAIQTRDEKGLQMADTFLAELKKKNLLDASATILRTEPIIYEQWPANRLKISADLKPWIEVLETSHLANMSRLITRWKDRLPIYHNP